MRRLINKEIVDDLWSKGYTYETIAKELGFTRDSVGRFFRKHYGLLEDRGRSTRQTLPIMQEQKEIIFGSTLGDLCIRPTSRSAMGTEIHSIKQLEYAKYKHSLLLPLVSEMHPVEVVLDGKTYPEVRWVLRVNTNLVPFRKAFYDDHGGKKDVPYDLQLLTPRAIAFWFMDDGFHTTNGHSETVGFSTCALSLDGLDRLQTYLYETYGIEVIVRPKTHYTLARRKSAKQLAEMMKPFMIDSMYYKLGTILG